MRASHRRSRILTIHDTVLSIHFHHPPFADRKDPPASLGFPPQTGQITPSGAPKNCHAMTSTVDGFHKVLFRPHPSP
jgi:hypothetical protein